jgi:hypothetical protein
MKNERAACAHANPVPYRHSRCIECVRESRRRAHRKAIHFRELWDAQCGLCAFCGKPLFERPTPHRDHDHATGRVRGLVHRKCNQAIAGLEAVLGMMDLDDAIAYIKG